ncbi:MAG TPA: hypothetical protein VE980_05180 [Pyrinomonadaceae bacterium]|nr:hypothetical protein [Pyrinomonadaceae bacterium]
MRDLTSTKREFTALARRLYRRGPLSGNRAFRGVIGQGFGIWIREHWGLSDPGLFRPVGREFQTQKKPFALLNWPQQKRAGETNYNFSTTLHLTCFPQHTNHSLFELNTSGVFQTLALKQQAGAREEFVRNVLVEGADRRTRDYSFLERIFHTFNRESNTHRQNTKLKEFLSSLFSTFNQTVGEVTRSRDSERSFWSKEQRFDLEKNLRTEVQKFDAEKSLRSEVRKFERATSFRRDFALVRSSSATTDVRNHFVVTLPPLILAGNSTGERSDNKTVSNPALSNLSTSNHWHKTLNLHPRLDHQFLITRTLSAKNDPADSETHFGTNVFTTLALNFAAPKVSETELVAQRISQFVSAPELTHVKREQGMSDEMLKALRGLRTPYVEPKPVPMPAMPSIEQLTNQVRAQLERELRIERERRGL